MTVIDAIRAAAARRQAIFTYAAAHDRWAEAEQIYRAEGREFEAEGAHEMGRLCLQSYLKEMDDPEPVGLGSEPPYPVHRYYSEDRG